MKVCLEQHMNHAKELTQKLAAINGELPFGKAVDLAKQVGKKMEEKYPDRVFKGTWTRSAGKGVEGEGQIVQFQHFGEYFGLRYSEETGRYAQVALGYDCRHWVYTGDVEIPWRVFLSDTMSGGTNPGIPDFVEKRIQRGNMRDGFTWVYYGKGLQGRDYPFILIPKEKLPSVADDDPAYVEQLADAVFCFLDELYKP